LLGRPVKDSTLFRSHGVELSEHGLNGVAPAVRTDGVRPPVLSDALPTLKDLSTFPASEFIGRHEQDLQEQSGARARDRRPRRRNSVYAHDRTHKRPRKHLLGSRHRLTAAARFPRNAKVGEVRNVAPRHLLCGRTCLWRLSYKVTAIVRQKS